MRLAKQRHLIEGHGFVAIAIFIYGNHSPTMFPAFQHAKVAGKPVPDVIGHHEWLRGEFCETVGKRGAAIIAARGASRQFAGISHNTHFTLTALRLGRCCG